MKGTEIVVQGILKPDGTLELDERLTLSPGRVQVTVQSVRENEGFRPSLIEVIEKIRRDQAARGYEGRSMKEMAEDEATQKVRNEEYEKRWRQIW